MFARLCQHHPTVEVKRRHSWNSDSEFQVPEHLLEQQLDIDPEDAWHLLVPDLVTPCRGLDDAGLITSSEDEHEDDEDAVDDEDDDDDTPAVVDDDADVEVMGQRPSFLLARSRPKISLTWVLRGESHQAVVARQTPLANNVIINNAEKPASYLHAPRTCGSALLKESHRTASEVSVNGRPKRTLSEPSLVVGSENTGRSSRASRDKPRHRHRTRSSRHRSEKHRRHSRFGYEIKDIDAFLSKASLEKPGNIPVVLASPSMLYMTRQGGYQEEIALPLGMVVNAVFKNQIWLYVQTPHGKEGYVSYAACLPLGILPPPQRSHSTSKPPPCWESHTDIFPLPLGNQTDNEKMRDGTRSECGGRYAKQRARYERDAVSACGERSVDRLYLRAAASAKVKGVKRHTLLVIRSDYSSKGRNTLSVTKGDVVVLVSNHMKDWFWVRSRDGNEGFIPSVVGGHGFL